MAARRDGFFPLSGGRLLPLVSVIMPAFQAAGTLERAARSVLIQDPARLELLIVDDASSDQTLTVAQKLATQDTRVKVLLHPQNLGAAEARNTALRVAAGRYLAFLDADDEWLPGKLDRQITAMQSHKASLCYGAFWRQSQAGRHLVQVPQQLSYPELLRGNVIGCLTAVVDRTAFDAPLQMPLLRRRQDFAFWLLLLRKGAVTWGVQEPLAIYHQSAGSLSSARLAALQATWRVYHDAEGLSPLRSAQLTASHLLRRVLRG